METRRNGVEGKKNLSEWHTGASKLFNGTQVSTIFYNGIQVKASKIDWLRGKSSSFHYCQVQFLTPVMNDAFRGIITFAFYAS
jgi:hypothetical protein